MTRSLTTAEEGAKACLHCGKPLNAEEIEFYGNGCETCERELHDAMQEERAPVLPPPSEAETRALLASLERELGVTGTANVFRKALVYAKEARAESRASSAEAEVERLKARLEIDHAYDIDGNKKPFPAGMERWDGIACRDETIKGLEEVTEALRERVARLEHGLEAIGFLYDGRPRDGSNLVDDFPSWARQALRDGRNVE